MIILGLTGGIATGKSTIAHFLKRMKIPIYDADVAVHALLGKKGAAVEKVSALFPGVEKNGAIDRRKLGEAVFGKPERLQQLERLMHPLVRAQEQTFIKRMRYARKAAVALEIPLLFELGDEARMDKVITTTAPRFIQTRRALARKHMNPEKLAAILLRQLSNAERQRRADAVIHTGLGKAHTLRELKTALARWGVRR